MKKLLFLFLICSCTIIQAQDSAKLSVREVYEDAKQGITRLVEQLGGPAKHVYRVYVYQHRTEGIAILCVSLLLFIISSGLLLKHYGKADFMEGNKSSFAAGAGIVLFIAAIIASITFFAGEGFTKLINPEYFAIQDIIKAFK